MALSWRNQWRISGEASGGIAAKRGVSIRNGYCGASLAANGNNVAYGESQ
jgi:hypothetical protein